jgi:hypothetical protein
MASDLGGMEPDLGGDIPPVEGGEATPPDTATGGELGGEPAGGGVEQTI